MERATMIWRVAISKGSRLPSASKVTVMLGLAQTAKDAAEFALTSANRAWKTKDTQDLYVYSVEYVGEVEF